MRKKEELEELVGQVLVQPRSEYPLVVDIGRLSGSQSQATKACEILGLSKHDLVRARWVAVHKREILEENPEADYSQVLEEIRNKESKMPKTSDLKKRVEELREKIRVTELEKTTQKETQKRKRRKREEEFIREFCRMVIVEFEGAFRDFQKSDDSVSFNPTPEFEIEWPSESSSRRIPTDDELTKVRQALENLKFKVEDIQSAAVFPHIRVTLEKRVTGDSVV